MDQKYARISACGLDCTTCDLFLLPTSAAVQAKILPWFRTQKWLGEGEGIEVVIEKRMYCKGCSVDLEVFWSGDCEIAKCCIATHRHGNCSECEQFPCYINKKWSEQGGKYKDAYEYLLSAKQRLS